MLHFAKALMLGKRRTKVALLTIMDEWGDFVDFKLLNNHSESLENIVPALAEIVYGSLLYGPYRSEPFCFCSDNAESHKNVPEKVFIHIINHLNDGNEILKSKNGYNYNLNELRKSALVKSIHKYIYISLLIHIQIYININI